MAANSWHQWVVWKVRAMTTNQGFDTDALRRRLLAERSELLSKVSLPVDNNYLANDERDSDEADAAISTALREQAMWLAQDARQRLELIQETLQRMEDGSYGHCQSCGQLINPERLEALPYATQCIRCQELTEHQGRRPGRGRHLTDG